MTALTKFQRLESTGTWLSGDGSAPGEVLVQLGDATLTITDFRMSVLSHWSLPAVRRVNPGALPARYVPGDDSPETLEIEDPLMIGAIEKVLTSLARRRSDPARRLRRPVLIGAAVVTVLATVIWAPRAMVAEVLSVAPYAKRVELGEGILKAMQPATGGVCDEPLGRRALERLRIRLLPDQRGRVIVVKGGLPQGQYLPGGLLLISNQMIVQHDDPAVLAGHVLALDEASRSQDPLRRLLRDAGPIGTLQMLTTGKLSERHLVSHSAHLLETPPDAPEDAGLIARMQAADVPVAPYAASLGAAGAGLAAAPPLPAGSARPVLTDDDWVALQQICGE